MADEKQLIRLKKGVKAWNRWRKQHPNVKIDLTGADLSGANLNHANLSEADLSGASLSWANLSHANLTEANLSDANQYCANLYFAVPREAEVEHAPFPEVDLSTAEGLQTEKQLAFTPWHLRDLFALAILVLSSVFYWYISMPVSSEQIKLADSSGRPDRVVSEIIYLFWGGGWLAILWVESKVLHYVFGCHDFVS